MRIEVQAFFHEDTFTVSYVVWAEGHTQCAVIDPVLDYDAASGRTSTTAVDELLSFVESRKLDVKYVLETHVHADHLSAAPIIRKRCSAKLCIGAGTRKVAELFSPVFQLSVDSDIELVPAFFDQLLDDNDELELDGTTIRVLATPGHTVGCVTYQIGDAVFVGDTLFMPDFGTARTDFPGGDAATLYRSIRRVLALPKSTRLFMCHDYKAPGRDQYVWETTVAEQRESNIHIHDGVSEEEYVRFREERDASLAMPKLLLPSVQVNMRGGQLPEPDEKGIRYVQIPIDYF